MTKHTQHPAPVPVELLQGHTHQGVDHQPGARIWVRPDQRDRLIAAGTAKDCAECGAAQAAPVAIAVATIVEPEPEAAAPASTSTKGNKRHGNDL